MRHYCLLLIIFLSNIILLECMVFTSSYLLHYLLHRSLGNAVHLVRHIIKSCYKVYLLTYLFQHLYNEQNLNTRNYTAFNLLIIRLTYDL